jgi:hypothetical protein
MDDMGMPGGGFTGGGVARGEVVGGGVVGGGIVGEPPEVPGFELGELLARGGTSEVWAGVSLAEGRRVAVKVVHASVDSVEAAAREAAVSSRAASAHVVAIDACVALGDGRVALVMPHLRGGSLDALVRARGHLSPGEVVTVLAPVASALGRLHDLAVVHGDVSPGNVLLDLDGRPVLGDLGLGHVLGDISPGVWGTDGYVAPEVVLGGDPSPASDVYGLGALGWLCLTGSVPGAPGLRPALAGLSRAGEAAVPVIDVLESALSPDPGERPDAHEFAWLLFQAAAAKPLDLVRGGDEVSAVTYRLRAAAGADEGVPDTPRRRPGLVHRVRPSTSHTRGPGGSRGPRTAVTRRRGRHTRPVSRGSSSWARVVASAVGAVALAVALVLAVTVLGRDGGSAVAGGVLPDTVAVDRTAAPVSTPMPSSTPTPTPTTQTRSDPRHDPDAPSQRPTELLTALADARAAAWREATPAMLHGADAPGSPALARDTAAVAEVARSGLRYAGLRYTVAEARAVSATRDEAVVRARIDAGTYTVLGRSGSQSRPASTGEVVLVHLVRTDEGWRIADLRPAA